MTPPRVVLLVDDSQTVRRLIEWSLKPAGLKALHAADGLQALEILRAEAVDLAVVDLNMPRMDGIELIRCVRADERLKHLPIILLTTEGRIEDRKAGLEAGANRFLTKPSPPEVLRAEVQALLQAAEARS
ncbi:MAG TPA: response regulator [Planctomycetota bacterium]